MKQFRITPLVVFLLPWILLLCPPVQGQMEWRPVPGNSQEYALWDRGIQLGSYHAETGIYRPLLDGVVGQRPWGEPCAPPIDPPIKNFGLDASRIREGSHYRLNGKEVDRQRIQDVLSQDSRIPDDAGRKRLTLIGTPEQTEPILKDFATHPSLAPFKDTLLVAAYPPTHWCIQRQAFSTRGSPTIYLQDTDGTVLHRQDDYQGGAEELARGLRQADPNYKPDNDPDRRKKRTLPGLPSLGNVPWSLVGALGIAVFVLVYFPGLSQISSRSGCQIHPVFQGFDHLC